MTEAELRKKASEFKSRAATVREQALSVISAVARNSLLMAANTWERLAQAREDDANLLKHQGDDSRKWR